MNFNKIIDMKEDGFTKSTQLHSTGSLNTLANLNGMDSYQSRFGIQI
jgi:hypothetical protein